MKKIGSVDALIVIIFMVATVVVLYNVHSHNEKVKAHWLELAGVSEAHGVVVSTFSECRNKILDNAFNECLTASYKAGAASGIDAAEVRSIIKDIRLHHKEYAE